jgi:hypothetical protein
VGVEPTRGITPTDFKSVAAAISPPPRIRFSHAILSPFARIVNKSVHTSAYVHVSSYFLPSVLSQINPTRAIKPHAFLFQSCALFVIAGGRSQTDFTARVDDAIPWHVVGAIVHRPADRARGTRRAERQCNLPVRDHAPARHPAHKFVYTLEETVRWFQVSGFKILGFVGRLLTVD